MGNPAKKRGGAPLHGDEAKRSAIAVRTTASNKRRLEDAANAEGRSLTQEIERRLERSLERESQMGGAEAVRMLDEIGLSLRRLGNSTATATLLVAITQEIARLQDKVGAKWNEDGTVYYAVAEALKNVVHRQRPPFPNEAAVSASSLKMRATELAVQDVIDALLSVGVLTKGRRRNALMSAFEPIGLLGAEMPRPKATEPIQTPQDIALEHAFARYEVHLAVSLGEPPESWVVLVDVNAEQRQCAVDAMAGLPTLMDSAEEAREIYHKLCEPVLQAYRAGKELAAPPSILINDEQEGI